MKCVHLYQADTILSLGIQKFCYHQWGDCWPRYDFDDTKYLSANVVIVYLRMIVGPLNNLKIVH